MTGTDVTTLRTEASRALAVGDVSGANETYARELATLAGTEPATVAPATTAVVTPANGAPTAGEVVGYIADALGGPPVAVYPLPDSDVRAYRTIMGRWNGWGTAPGADTLLDKWGADAATNLGYAESFRIAHPDVGEVALRAGIGDMPAIIEMAALMGRRMATEQQVARGTQPMQQHEQPADREALRAIREQTRTALADGDHKEANRLYAVEQALIAKTQGNRPIVGGLGRSA